MKIIEKVTKNRHSNHIWVARCTEAMWEVLLGKTKAEAAGDGCKALEWGQSQKYYWEWTLYEPKGVDWKEAEKIWLGFVGQEKWKSCFWSSPSTNPKACPCQESTAGISQSKEEELRQAYSIWAGTSTFGGAINSFAWPNLKDRCKEMCRWSSL